MPKRGVCVNTLDYYPQYIASKNGSQGKLKNAG